MLFIVATVGEVDDIDFALAWRHGQSAYGFASGEVVD
jgi:hypothetical protein